MVWSVHHPVRQEQDVGDDCAYLGRRRVRNFGMDDIQPGSIPEHETRRARRPITGCTVGASAFSAKGSLHAYRHRWQDSYIAEDAQ